jgi:hypothetical protein
MTGSITGLSADTLDYLVLALTVASPIVGFIVQRTGSKLLGYVQKGLDLLRLKLVGARALKEPPKP